MGCPRSGTTLVQLMLHAHAEIAIPPENRFLLEVYDRHEHFGDLREHTNRRKLAKWLCTYLDEPFDPAMLAPQEVAEVAVPERKVWHARTHRDTDDAAVERWRDSVPGARCTACAPSGATHGADGAMTSPSLRQLESRR